MKEFYEDLKKKRLAKGVSLDEIHQKTRLPLHYLEAIEAGELKKLPDTYVRMYLRRYANEIGANPQEVVRDYDVLTGRLSPPDSNVFKKDDESKSPLKKLVDIDSIGASQSLNNVKEQLEEVNFDRTRNLFWAGLGAILLVVAIYFVYQQFTGDNQSNSPEIKEITIDELLNEIDPDSNTRIAASDSIESAAALLSASSTSFEVELRCNERVWVREVRDEKDTTEYILTAGLRHTAKALNRLDFLIGRANAVEIWFNGTNLGFPGQQNQIAILSLTPQGLIQKRLRTIKKPNSRSENIDSSETNNIQQESL